MLHTRDCLINCNRDEFQSNTFKNKVNMYSSRRARTFFFDALPVGLVLLLLLAIEGDGAAFAAD